ncbi:E3 ubiquitin-protein ligase listerin isoform X1 [Drosophila albomicans]|uniref:E3 ubiquitin-protein ligase listerin n=1 Tax=Drosophila albomicans TaxID=7291 RepID=A0A6P8WXT1_DROAB|nr:E3 ubiquitin-protein ligase listerin isoform X1 [Drosophila albomicans]
MQCFIAFANYGHIASLLQRVRMGGKTKQTPRTKNNAKPSSSSRSAELLGTTTPVFVGFSAQADGNLVPFAPGFASAEQMPETFDVNISPQTQIILRKLTKKDPMTKKKALQELHELITESDVESLKNILPLWPKFYHNLASDIEHAVREQTQLVLQLLMSKCKRAMAPYLKQLVPVWLASRFDNYAPAASIASNSFRETFARTCEVCLHCQAEIIEYTTRNLTFHTPATLSMGKNLKPEESEAKYHRVVISSLKELSFFIEQTAQAEDLEQLKQGLATLLAHPKFWTFAKSKQTAIKAAWFECIYHILQSVKLEPVVTPQKAQLITTSFQFIDDADPLVAPHVWGCVLLLQSNYEDWYAPLNIRKALLPKLSTLLSNAFNRNAQAICPNLLPFLSKVTSNSLQGLDIYEFYQRFFDNLKTAIVGPHDPPLSKADTSIIHSAYFECLRFMLQQINNDAERTEAMQQFAFGLLEQQLLQPIGQLLLSENTHAKYFFQHTSALVAFWDRQCNSELKSSCALYVKLLNVFWTRIFEMVTQDLAAEDINEQWLSHVLLLVQDLHVANPSLETQSVKFLETDNEKAEVSEQCSQHSTPTKKGDCYAAFIQKELKQLVVKLMRICLDKANSSSNSGRYIHQVRTLTKMFTDIEFYKSLTEQGELSATLDKFVALLGQLNVDACESVVEIVFEILALLESSQRFDYIAQKLLKLQQHTVQNMLLHRLLSYPLCTEPAVRQMLASPETCGIISRIAEEVVVDNNRDKLNLLHKCFFQTDTGDILINAATVDKIVLAMCAPLEQPPSSDMVEVCGSFIAQIMPVICSQANSSLPVRQQVFLRLFKFSLEQRVGDYLSEDTLWEITTCWQDALSSKDIEIDDALLKDCAGIVEELTHNAELSASSLESMAEAMAKFVICSTENIEDDSQRSARIDESIAALLSSTLKTAESVLQFEHHCVYLEALQESISAGVAFDKAELDEAKILPLVRRAALNFTTICKLVCRVDNPQLANQSNEAEDELTEDYCDPNANLLKQWSESLILEILQCINVASAADTWIEVSSHLDDASEELVLCLSEQVRSFMGNSSELVNIIKERLIQAALQQDSVMSCRQLGYLIHYSQYAPFEESATILLHEDLAELLVSKGALKAYVMTLQHLLPKLSQKALNLNGAIMRTEPDDMWVKAAVFRCLVLNNFQSDVNEQTDHNIIASALQFLTRVNEQQNAQKDLLHYNVELLKQPYDSVLSTVEIIKLLNEVLQRFPYELTIKNWDAIRIGLSSWVLSVSKSIKNYTDPKTSFFIVAVYQLFASLVNFIRAEKQKSSTEMLKSVVDEWESVFAREVNVVLFKSYYELTYDANVPPENRVCYELLLERLMPSIEMLDYSFVYGFCKAPSSKLSLDHLCNLLLKQLHSTQYSLRMNAVHALRQLTSHFVADDIMVNDKQNDNLEAACSTISKWHFLNRFEDYLTRYDTLMHKYLEEFSFKLAELEDLEPIDRHDAFSYLLIWDCIINVCAKSPVALRSVYTSWLHENHYEENFLHFLFRAMPVDILKNHSAKWHSNDIYKELSWSQLKDPQLSVERYACHLYSQVLRKLPAVVRKWWNTSQSRQKNFVDNLTTNYVSALICTEELKAIANRKEKHENMQVTVHTSTREVLAVYALDEARMELVITLAANYPLGAVKVECGNQIGGRANARNVGMQLTIYLTHQNGTIYDGLTLWKNNLDKKFEGVEECYVCYTVIHQDTCQLPKLTCKTCKKKFHGPCLYKWFTTSSKSTCPICRNVF